MDTTTLTLRSPYEGSKVTIYNSHNQIVLDEYIDDKSTFSLPNGIYTVRAELSGQLEDRVLLLRGRPIDYPLNLPYFSATPLPDIQSSPTYYTEDAHALSINPKWLTNSTDTGNSSFFAFLRFRKKDHFLKYQSHPSSLYSLIHVFALLDQGQNRVTTATDWQINNEVGWIGLSIQLPPGLYFLIYCPSLNPNECRQIPIYIFAHWQTQLFITLDPLPLFSGMRIQMALPGQGLRQISQQAYAIDYATDRLQNHQFNFPEIILNALRGNSQINPILGILWLYSYLLDDQPERDYTEAEGVLNWLHDTIPTDWPDWQVLRLLANQKMGKIGLDSISSPPMLTLGMEQLIQLAITSPSVIPDKSLNDTISTDLYADMVWTSWQPAWEILSLVRSDLSSGSSTEFIRRLEPITSAPFSRVNPPFRLERVNFDSWTSRQQAKPNEPNWAAIQVIKALDKHRNITLTGIAEQLVIPVTTTKRIAQELLDQELTRKQVLKTLRERKLIKLPDAKLVLLLKDLVSPLEPVISSVSLPSPSQVTAGETTAKKARRVRTKARNTSIFNINDPRIIQLLELANQLSTERKQPSGHIRDYARSILAGLFSLEDKSDFPMFVDQLAHLKFRGALTIENFSALGEVIVNALSMTLQAALQEKDQELVVTYLLLFSDLWDLRYRFLVAYEAVSSMSDSSGYIGSSDASNSRSLRGNFFLIFNDLTDILDYYLTSKEHNEPIDFVINLFKSVNDRYHVEAY